MMNLSTLLNWYSGKIDSFPLVTTTITTVLIGLLGDGMAQFQEERLKREEIRARRSETDELTYSFKYDRRRGLANIADSVVFTAPIYHYGYAYLEALLPIIESTTSLLDNTFSALLQVLVDCILFDAVFVFLMFASSEIIEGWNRNRETATSSMVRTRLIPAILASWKVNILILPVEFVLFRYFPLRFRVLGMNLIDLVWDAVVSFAIHNKGKEDDIRLEEKSRVNEIRERSDSRSTCASSTPSTPTSPETSWADDNSAPPEMPLIECTASRISKKKQN